MIQSFIPCLMKTAKAYACNLTPPEILSNFKGLPSHESHYDTVQKTLMKYPVHLTVVSLFIYASWIIVVCGKITILR